VCGIRASSCRSTTDKLDQWLNLGRQPRPEQRAPNRAVRLASSDRVVVATMGRIERANPFAHVASIAYALLGFKCDPIRAPRANSAQIQLAFHLGSVSPICGSEAVREHQLIRARKGGMQLGYAIFRMRHKSRAAVHKQGLCGPQLQRSSQELHHLRSSGRSSTSAVAGTVRWKLPACSHRTSGQVSVTIRCARGIDSRAATRKPPAACAQPILPRVVCACT
jgi:hypothetical protein